MKRVLITGGSGFCSKPAAEMFGYTYADIGKAASLLSYQPSTDLM